MVGCTRRRGCPRRCKPTTQGINIWDRKGLHPRQVHGEGAGKSPRQPPTISDRTNSPRVTRRRLRRQQRTPSRSSGPSSSPSLIWWWRRCTSTGGPKDMFAKLKNALGPGCFIAEDMVCCKKIPSWRRGAHRLQGAMAASQTWIRERRERRLCRGTRRPAAPVERRDSTGAGATDPQPPPARWPGGVAQGITDGPAPRGWASREGREDRDWDDETFFDAEDDAFTMFSSFAERGVSERGVSGGYARVPEGGAASAPASANGANGFDGGCAPIGRRRTRRGAKDPSSRRRERGGEALLRVLLSTRRRNEDCSASGDAWKCDALDSYRQRPGDGLRRLLTNATRRGGVVHSSTRVAERNAQSSGDGLLRGKKAEALLARDALLGELIVGS